MEEKKIHPNKGKTYEELYGETRGKSLRELRRQHHVGRSYAQGYKLPSNKVVVCNYCKKEFLASSKLRKFCDYCLTPVTIICQCGCGETVVKLKHLVEEYPFKRSHKTYLNKGKTYEEIYGQEKATEIKKNVSKGLKLAPRKQVYESKKKQKYTCRYCNQIFLAADVKACICSDCYSIVDITCTCGCGQILRREKWKVDQELPAYAMGHYLKGKSYKEIHGTSTPACGFKRGVENIVHRPTVKEKIAGKHHLSTRSSKLEVILKPHLHEWTSQYIVKYWVVDFALPREKIVLEINGCYWHSCSECGYFPKYREQQVALSRDLRLANHLSESGWKLLIVWEHEFSLGVGKIMEKINASRTIS